MQRERGASAVTPAPGSLGQLPRPGRVGCMKRRDSARCAAPPPGTRAGVALGRTGPARVEREHCDAAHLLLFPGNSLVASAETAAPPHNLHCRPPSRSSGDRGMGRRVRRRDELEAQLVATSEAPRLHGKNAGPLMRSAVQVERALALRASLTGRAEPYCCTWIVSTSVACSFAHFKWRTRCTGDEAP
jgi:hypothetical protein